MCGPPRRDTPMIPPRRAPSQDAPGSDTRRRGARAESLNRLLGLVSSPEGATPIEPGTGGCPMCADTAPPQQPPEAALARPVSAQCPSTAASVAARLRVADLLADGRRPLADLAAGTKTHAPSLYRVLRSLAAAGVFAEQADGRFALTPMGQFLRTGVKGSLRGVADYCGSDWSWRAWGRMLESVQTGRTAFDSVFGEPVFDYLAKHPDQSAVFNEGMTGSSSNVAPAVAEAYDFAAFRTVVDVGGGHGVLLRTILHAYPGVTGIVFDSPHVAAGAEAAIREAGLTGRCRAVGGDFFQ